MPRANSFCGLLDPTPVRGRLAICLLAPGHPGRCTWNVCGNDGGAGPDGGIHCERPRKHRGLHRMTW